MDILQKIAAHKRKETGLRKQLFPVRMLEKSQFFNRHMPSFYDALKKKGPSVIAEFKRKSPSKGIINNTSVIEDVIEGYNKAGAAAISVLTDYEFFGGSKNDLEKAASVSGVPLLRKDFIVDEYQVIEARSAGASAILLIAAILEKAEVEKLSALAKSLDLDVLFEIHSPEEIGKASSDIRIAGVNNRNLNTFETDMDLSMRLFSSIPRDFAKVAESGINSPATVLELFSRGYDAFLIGENFMRSSDPAASATEFIGQLIHKDGNTR